MVLGGVTLWTRVAILLSLWVLGLPHLRRVPCGPDTLSLNLDMYDYVGDAL